MFVANFGAALFGLVIGWVTYRTLVRNDGKVSLSDIATVLGAVGGAAVVGLFGTPELFGYYSIGLAVGFFAYILVFALLNGSKTTGGVLGGGGEVTKDDRV